LQFSKLLFEVQSLNEKNFNHSATSLKELRAGESGNLLPILGIGVTREYNRPPSKTKDIYWIEASPEYIEANSDQRLAGKWLVYVALRKLDESWEKIRKATVDSRLGFLSKSATAKKNFMPNTSNRMIIVYTHNYYDIDEVLAVGRGLNDLGFGITGPIYYETDDVKHAHRHVVKGDSNMPLYRCLKGRFWSRDENNNWLEI
jgi:hypothetical protein